MGIVWFIVMYVFDNNATYTSLSRPRNVDSVVVAGTNSTIEFAQIYSAVLQSRNAVVCMTCNYHKNSHYMHIARCLEIQQGFHSDRRPDANCCKFGQVCSTNRRWDATVEDNYCELISEQSEVCISIISVNLELIKIPLWHQARRLMHTRRRCSASASSLFMK